MVDHDENPLLNQSQFSTAQTLLQSPPPEEKPHRAWYQNTLVILVGLLLFFVIGIIFSRLSSRPMTPPPPIAPSPEVTPQVTYTPMEQELLHTSTTIEAANPDSNIISHPQVDMEVEF